MNPLPHGAKAMLEPNPTRRKFIYGTGATLLTAGLATLAAGAEPLAPPDKQPPNLPIPTPPQKRVGFAVVGLGELALEEIMPAFDICASATPVALVSGHRDKAEKVAAHYGIDPKNIYNYDNFDLIKDNPQVQVVYIVLPNSMHAEYTIRSFAAGKHVLCEKPMAVTSAECQPMIDAGKKADRKLMIAYRLRHEPYNKLVIEMTKRKELGPVRVISAENLQNTTAPNIRLSKALGGGPLGDVGVYCINASRYITGEEPIEVTGQQWADPHDDRFREVPSSVLFTLRFPSGALAHCAGGFDSTRSDRYRVTCADGFIDLDPAFGYVGQRLKISKKGMADEANAAGVSQAPTTETEVVMEHANHFAREMDHFAECVLKNTQPITPGEEGLTDMKIMAAIQRSIDEKTAIKLEPTA
jgi:predicted dehydrogenase